RCFCATTPEGSLHIAPSGRAPSPRRARDPSFPFFWRRPLLIRHRSSFDRTEGKWFGDAFAPAPNPWETHRPPVHALLGPRSPTLSFDGPRRDFPRAPGTPRRDANRT